LNKETHLIAKLIEPWTFLFETTCR